MDSNHIQVTVRTRTSSRIDDADLKLPQYVQQDFDNLILQQIHSANSESDARDAHFLLQSPQRTDGNLAPKATSLSLASEQVLSSIHLTQQLADAVSHFDPPPMPDADLGVKQRPHITMIASIDTVVASMQSLFVAREIVWSFDEKSCRFTCDAAVESVPLHFAVYLYRIDDDRVVAEFGRTGGDGFDFCQVVLQLKRDLHNLLSCEGATPPPAPSMHPPEIKLEKKSCECSLTKLLKMAQSTINEVRLEALRCMANLSSRPDAPSNSMWSRTPCMDLVFKAIEGLDEETQRTTACVAANLLGRCTLFANRFVGGGGFDKVLIVAEHAKTPALVLECIRALAGLVQSHGEAAESFKPRILSVLAKVENDAGARRFDHDIEKLRAFVEADS